VIFVAVVNDVGKSFRHRTQRIALTLVAPGVMDWATWYANGSSWVVRSFSRRPRM
jgi:hypothetical protein